MKFSLKTKFYIFILPFVLVLPVLLYSLVAPYSQMKTVFSDFQDDAKIAVDIEILSQAIEFQQLELFHYIAKVSKENKQDFIQAQVQTKHTFEQIAQQES